MPHNKAALVVSQARSDVVKCYIARFNSRGANLRVVVFELFSVDE